MSDTTYIHEASQGKEFRVSLTMDTDEVRALGEVAAAAIDASMLLGGDVDNPVLANAEAIYKWADNVANTLSTVISRRNGGGNAEE